MTCPTFSAINFSSQLSAVRSHSYSNSDFYIAAAPLTISIISFVIFAWRARFITRVSESIMSVALLVADIHCRHAGRVFGSHRLQQRTENLYADVLWQQRAEQFFRRLLVNVIHLRRAELRLLPLSSLGGVAGRTPAPVPRGFYGLLLLFLGRLFGMAHFPARRSARWEESAQPRGAARLPT